MPHDTSMPHVLESWPHAVPPWGHRLGSLRASAAVFPDTLPPEAPLPIAEHPHARCTP